MQPAVTFAKALADATRLRVIAALRQRELCVCELCDALEATQSTLSTHLTLLRDAASPLYSEETEHLLGPALRRILGALEP